MGAGEGSVSFVYATVLSSRGPNLGKTNSLEFNARCSEELLILLHESVLRLGQDSEQVCLGQGLERGGDR